MIKFRKTMAVLLAIAMSVTFAVSSADAAAKKPKLSKKNLTLYVGKTKKIKVKRAANAKISWKSSKKKVATVKKSGKYACKVTAVKKGTAVVTCTVKKGTKRSVLKCKVKVKAKTSPDIIPSPTPSKEAQTPSPSPSASPSQDGSQTTPGQSENPQSPSPGLPDTSTPSPTKSPDTSSTPPSTEPDQTFTPVEYKNAGFENGADGFTGRGGAETISVVDDGYSGKCIYVTGRTQSWHGTKIDMTTTVVPGATYSVTAYMKHMAGKDVEIKCSAETNGTYPAIASVAKAKSGEWTKLEGTVKVPGSISDFSIYFEIPGDAKADFYLDSVVITQISAPKEPVETQSIIETYKEIFPYMGTCANYIGYGNKAQQLQNAATVSFIKKHFNSITLENEMKPDAILVTDQTGTGATKLTKTQAQSSSYNYIIPENYTEANVPKLNFDVVDRTLEFCKKEGIKMRAHTLMWHQQTPSWFFTKDYAGSQTVDANTMNARIEFYVCTLMTHVMEKEKALTGEVGSLVYAWDVTNEYLHRSNGPTSSSWVSVYGDLGLQPTYVKKAFRTAYDVLESYDAVDKVTLFYNDYDTYFCADDLVKLVTYINSGETDKNGNPVKICGGIGMQSHVDALRPTTAQYGAALDKFIATGLEVQITELDATINFGQQSNGNWGYVDTGMTDDDQAAYVKELMELIITKHKNRDKSVNPKGITGVTIWGLYDSCSWRSECSPLLFGTSITDPKASFFSFIEAADIWKEK